jgi:hypothetical protein
MAAIYEGVLAVAGLSGRALDQRHITTESAHAPSWQGDSRHILYQALDQLRILDLETGETRTVPLELTYTPAVPTGRLVVHAGTLIDMTSPAVQSHVDITLRATDRSVVPTPTPPPRPSVDASHPARCRG